MDYLVLLVFTFTVYIILVLCFNDNIAIIGTIATCMILLIDSISCGIKDGFVGNGNSWTFKDVDDMLGYSKRDKHQGIIRMMDPIPSISGEEHIVDYGDGSGYQTNLLKHSVLLHNEKTLDKVLNTEEKSVDDKVFEQSRSEALKPKKSLDIRSHWNNNNWKKYFDYELNIHQNENRDWWTDDDFELSKKHVLV